MPSASEPRPPDRALADSGDPDDAVVLAIVSLLRQTRREKGLSLRELGEKTKIYHVHLSRAERGVSQPGLIVLIRWCRALDLRFIDVWKQASGEN